MRFGTFPNCLDVSVDDNQYAPLVIATAYDRGPKHMKASAGKIELRRVNGDIKLLVAEHPQRLLPQGFDWQKSQLLWRSEDEDKELDVASLLSRLRAFIATLPDEEPHLPEGAMAGDNAFDIYATRWTGWDIRQELIRLFPEAGVEGNG